MLGECLARADKYAVVLLKSFPSRAAGVGYDPEPFAEVRVSGLSRRYALPFDMMPDFGQGPENVAESAIEKPRYVFHDESGASLASKPDCFSEKPSAGAGRSKPLTRVGDAGVLAREAADDPSDAIKILSAQIAHVLENRHARPRPPQTRVAVAIDLAECHGLEAARPLKPQREAADAGKEIEHLERH